MKLHVAVIGAGAFGGWTALHLVERGARVTLLDAWGPGNSRSSSGGETRIMRGAYGPDQPYTALAARALQLWVKYEKRWKRQFLHRSGVLWMAGGGNDSFERGSIEALRRANIPFHELSTRAMRKRWPQIRFAGVEWGIFEPECGYLEARASCAAVVDWFVAGGGTYRQLQVSRAGWSTAMNKGLVLLDRDTPRLKADCYVFACGPWLAGMIPILRGVVRSTKQDVFFFGPPARDAIYFTDAHLPVWADHRERFFYGIPGNNGRGFKIADDTRGPEFEPTNGQRVIDQSALPTVREYLATRFPALAKAPLLESRVCQYEQTPDSHFIVDRHPGHENVWILGGGSGHGFKHGPALGEMMAELILNDGEAPAIWRLNRFQSGLATGARLRGDGSL